MVFGIGLFPMLAMFFASWLSEASMTAFVFPGFITGACTGSGKSASPETGS